MILISLLKQRKMSKKQNNKLAKEIVKDYSQTFTVLKKFDEGFITKDSGERKKFSSGMQRDVTTGKILYHLVASGPMLKRWAELLTRGAVKYDENNWMKANSEEELNRFRESAFRHFIQWYNNETDEDHGAAVIFNINGAEYTKAKLKE